MYRKEAHGLFKHKDFVILDLICLQISFIIAYILFHKGNITNPYGSSMYRMMAILISITSFTIMFSTNAFNNVLRRGYYKEFAATLKHALLVLASSILLLYMIKSAEGYSRLIFVGTFLIYTIFSYAVRLLWKRFLIKRMNGDGDRSLLILTNEDLADTVIKEIKKNSYGRFHLAGLVIMDRDMTGNLISNIEVVSDTENIAHYVCDKWIDEVLIVPSKPGEYPQEVYNNLIDAGITVHTTVAARKDENGRKQIVELIGDFTVITTSMNHAAEFDSFIKRLFDICGGIVGCLLTVLIFIFVAPAIYIQSPGPIFFCQDRIGKNGKPFKMYKFRSMYPDAEKRKEELLNQNKFQDGKMFKMDFDPRVIGNIQYLDGTRKTGIGQFIRKTSLDEFPQFWNVLKGDMPIVGTRPPLPGEVSEYELHHRARLSIKPGITGMWQVNGRSEIMDFDEVVELDRKYINNWNLGLDIKILCKTVGVIITGRGSI